MNDINKKHALIILRNKIKEDTKVMNFWVSRIEFNDSPEKIEEIMEDVEIRIKEIQDSIQTLRDFITGKIETPY